MEEENQDEFAPQEAQEGPGSDLEEQPAADQDSAPVDDFEAGSEDGEAQPETEDGETAIIKEGWKKRCEVRKKPEGPLICTGTQ